MSQQQYKPPSVIHCNMQAEQKQLGMNLQEGSFNDTKEGEQKEILIHRKNKVKGGVRAGWLL